MKISKFMIFAILIIANGVQLFSFESHYQQLNMPSFIENKGQILDSDGKIRNDILYYTNLQGMNIYFHKDKISYVFIQNSNFEQYIYTSNNFDVKLFRVDMKIDNASQEVNLHPKYALNDVINIYNHLNEGGLTGIKKYRTITYKNVYPNIDLEFYFVNDKLKYDFIINDKGNYQEIKLEYLGIQNIELIDRNNIQINTVAGEIFESLPLIYHKKTKNPIEGNFKIEGNTVSFNLNTKETDNIVIDPVLVWSSFMGGNAYDTFRAVSINSKNEIATCGISTSLNFPTTFGAYQRNNFGNEDWIVVKYDVNNKLLWSTYIGSSAVDAALNITYDLKDEIWIGGDSRGSGFPVTVNCYQSIYGGGVCDEALVKLDVDGQLLYSTYIGGNGYDGAPGLAIDNNNSIWISGQTESSNFKTSSIAYQKSVKSGFDANINCFDENGKSLLSTLLGGNGHDRFDGISFGDDGNPILYGFSSSTDMPVKTAIQATNKGSFDAFIAKLDKINGAPIWATYFGGSGHDVGFSISNTHNHEFAFTGFTNSNNFPTTSGCYQPTIGGGVDYFIGKFNEDGQLVMSSYFGGSKNDGKVTSDTHAGGVFIRNNGDIFFSGRTESNNFPTTADAFQNTFQGTQDGFLVSMSSSGVLLWSTYLGGSDDDYGYDVKVSRYDNFLVAVGATNSINFPVSSDAYQIYKKSSNDSYIIKFSLGDCDYRSFNFPNFDNVNKLNLINNTVKSGTGITLTPSQVWKGGALWYADKVPVGKGFKTEFSFSFSEGKNPYHKEDYPGADGIAFVIQNTQKNALGQLGGSLGYSGIPNSLAIEFDTYKNNFGEEVDNFHDQNENHIAVFCNGENKNLCDHNSTSNLSTNLDIIPIIPDGRKYFAKIEYNIDPNVLKVWLDSTTDFNEDPFIQLDNFELSKLIKLDADEFAWVGFTSSTGVVYQKHELHSWDFCSTPTSTILTEVDEENFKNSSEEINIYPNPASDEITIEFGSIMGINSMSVYDILGKKVAEYKIDTSNNNLKLKTDYLQSGNYYLQFRTATEVLIKNVLIIK